MKKKLNKTKDENKQRLSKQGLNAVTIGLVLFFGLAWSWVFFTDLLELAGSKTQGLLLAILISSIIICLSIVIIKVSIRLADSVFAKYNHVFSLFLALALFSLADFLVAWLTALFWIGPEGRVDSVLPLSSPTLLLVNTPFVYASRLVGFYGLAGFVWLLLYLVLSKRYRKAGLTMLMLGLTSIVGWYSYRIADGSSFTANVVSEALDNRVDPVDASVNDAKLTVFPEYGLDKVTNETISSRIFTDNPSKKHFFIGSEQVIPTGRVGHYNQLLFGDTQDGYTFKQDKYRLIPGGEDLPYLLRLGLRATNQKATLDYFSYAKGTLKGPKTLTPFELDQTTVVGSAVCSSIISPEDYRHFASSGSTILSNSASLSIFQGSSIFSFQQKSLAKFMAVANSRYFLQSANKARAFILDNNGNTLAEGKDHKLLSYTVRNNSYRTLYTIIGEWLVYSGLVVAIMLIYCKYMSKIQKPTKKKH